MKRVFVVCAVIAASSFGSMVSAADVEVYGKARLSVDVIDTGASAPEDDNVIKLDSNSSRLGFKGSEDLDGGLKAVYQVKLGVKMDGVLDTSLRNTFLGLSSDEAGTLSLANMTRPISWPQASWTHSATRRATTTRSSAM